MFSGKEWSWLKWLKRTNTIYMTHLAIFLYIDKIKKAWITYCSRLLIQSEIKEQKQQRDISRQNYSQLNQSQIQPERQQESSYTIICHYQKQQVSNQTKVDLPQIKQLQSTENKVQAYILMSQQFLAQNKKDQARNLLISAVKQISELKKQERILFYIEDQVDLRGRLIVLEAERSNLYQEYLKQLNTIYDDYPQYFFDHRITLLNNLSLAIQNSQRTDRYQQSMKYLQESLDFQFKYMIFKDERLYFTQNNLACAYFQNGQNENSAVLFKSLINQLGRQRQKYEQIIKICQNNYKHYFPNSEK